jgi:threonine dehydrogenase-like Zn-dependent dehydrogenase
MLMKIPLKTSAVSFRREKGIVTVQREINPPRENQVLIEMKACGICQYDIKCYKDIGTDPVYSKSPGHEGVGVVVEAGKNVEGIRPGDKVTSYSFCGAFADFYAADINTVALLPQEVEDFKYWAAEPIACIVNSLRFLRIEPGDDVVVMGCGYMGLLFIQGLPKNFINNLAAIDIDDDRLSFAREFGAGTIINAQRCDPVQAVFDTNKRQADVVIEAVGKKGAIGLATDMTRMGGRLCIFGHHAEDESVPTGEWHMKGIEVLNTTPFTSKDFHRDLIDAVKLMKKGTFDQTKLISRSYLLSDMKRAMEEVSRRPPDLIKTVVTSG